MDWFLYERDLRNERVNSLMECHSIKPFNTNFLTQTGSFQLHVYFSIYGLLDDTKQ